MRLSHISDFRGAADVSGGREQRVLNHRAEQSVRTEVLGRLLDQCREFFARKEGLARGKFAVVAANRLAAAVHRVEQKRGLAGDFHLRVKIALFELFGAVEQRIPERLILIERLLKYGGHQAVQAGVQLIDKNDSAPGQQPGHQLAEGRPVGLTGHVRFAKGLRDIVREAAFEGLRRRRHERIHGRTQANFSDPLSSVTFSRRQVILHKAAARVPDCVIHFGEIVVLCGEPEDRHGIGSAASQLLGADDGRDRFIERVGGPGEKPHLLAGNDCGRASGEAIDILFGGSIGSEPAILLAQHLDENAARGRIQLESRGLRRRFRPRREDGRSRKRPAGNPQERRKKAWWCQEFRGMKYSGTPSRKS